MQAPIPVVPQKKTNSPIKKSGQPGRVQFEIKPVGQKDDHYVRDEMSQEDPHPVAQQSMNNNNGGGAQYQQQQKQNYHHKKPYAQQQQIQQNGGRSLPNDPSQVIDTTWKSKDGQDIYVIHEAFQNIDRWPINVYSTYKRWTILYQKWPDQKKYYTSDFFTFVKNNVHVSEEEEKTLVPPNVKRDYDDRMMGEDEDFPDFPDEDEDDDPGYVQNPKYKKKPGSGFNSSQINGYSDDEWEDDDDCEEDEPAKHEIMQELSQYQQLSVSGQPIKPQAP